jgi:predicted methyltransferase
MSITFGLAISQVRYDLKKMEAIDKMRDRDLQPGKVMDAINLKQGMIVGEAGASYGYFTLWMSKRVGNKGIVYANDIDAAVLGLLVERCKSENITNIKTVLGSEDDPFYPTDDLDMEPRIDRKIQIGD